MMINKLSLFNILTFILSINCYSQLLIGKQNSSTSALIDFAENTYNGIVLPHVDDVNQIKDNTAGTILFDKSSKKVKYFNGEKWISMNREEGKNPLEDDSIEVVEKQGVIIGNETSDAKGILILESENKALVLPKILNPAKNVPSPYPGMICLDTISNNLYVFNGLVWEIWGY